MSATRTFRPVLPLTLLVALALAAFPSAADTARTDTAKTDTAATADAPDAPVFDPSKRIRPKATGRLSLQVLHRLNSGFQLAVKRLRQEPACQQLFTDLGANGLERLANMIYIPAPEGATVNGVDEVAAGKDDPYRLIAFTNVGSPLIRLTELFAHQTTDNAAAFLIHEALHFAGLGEWPSDPRGLKSPEITRLVADRCDLRSDEPAVPGLRLPEHELVHGR